MYDVFGYNQFGPPSNLLDEQTVAGDPLNDPAVYYTTCTIPIPHRRQVAVTARSRSCVCGHTYMTPTVYTLAARRPLQHVLEPIVGRRHVPEVLHACPFLGCLVACRTSCVRSGNPYAPGPEGVIDLGTPTNLTHMFFYHDWYRHRIRPFSALLLTLSS